MVTISREVVEGEDFLSLSSEDLVKLISSNDLAVPFEEKVSKLQMVVFNILYGKSTLKGGQVGITLLYGRCLE